MMLVIADITVFEGKPETKWNGSRLASPGASPDFHRAAEGRPDLVRFEIMLLDRKDFNLRFEGR